MADGGLQYAARRTNHLYVYVVGCIQNALGPAAAAVHALRRAIGLSFSFYKFIGWIVNRVNLGLHA